MKPAEIVKKLNNGAYNARKKLNNGAYNARFEALYGADEVEKQTQRYLKATELIPKELANKDFTIFSNPGRTELAGNHTDHNHGCVLAASVQLDLLAFAFKRDDTVVEIFSEGYPPAIVDIKDIEKKESEKGTTEALIRGIAARLKHLEYKVGGFSAYTTSNVPGGSGLSSSAAVEDLIGNIFSVFYNNKKIDPVTIAKAGQWAENNYFDKPCGLMDQIACAYGGIVAIDFADPQNPVINDVQFSFKKYGYDLLVVNTGGSHADLTDEYAAVPAEMKSVAKLFGQPYLRGLTVTDLMLRSVEIRNKCGDRAFLRALHFINENERPIKMVEALKANRIVDYLKLVKKSGLSSWRFLQNCTSVKDIQHQGVTTALAVTEQFFIDHGPGSIGVCRVHGGGFAGTIQVYIKSEYTGAYTRFMENMFGIGSVTPIKIRSEGTTVV